MMSSSGEDGWTADGWLISDGRFANNFAAETVDTKGVATARYPEPAPNSAMTLHSISSLSVNSETQVGTDKVSSTPVNSGRVKFMVVTNHAGHILNSGYLLDVR